MTGYEALIPALTLPDADDRHVLAAAIVGRCDVIVTQNLKDFPKAELAKYGVETQHPDEFVCNLIDLAPGLVCGAVARVRARLKSPPVSASDYLATLTRQGLVAAAGELQAFSELL